MTNETQVKEKTKNRTLKQILGTENPALGLRLDESDLAQLIETKVVNENMVSHQVYEALMTKCGCKPRIKVSKAKGESELKALGIDPKKLAELMKNNPAFAETLKKKVGN